MKLKEISNDLLMLEDLKTSIISPENIFMDGSRFEPVVFYWTYKDVGRDNFVELDIELLGFGHPEAEYESADGETGFIQFKNYDFELGVDSEEDSIRIGVTGMEINGKQITINFGGL